MNPTSPLGDRWFRGRDLPNILLPSGEGFTPAPTPSP